MPAITSYDQLIKIIQDRLSLALKNTQYEIYKVIHENVEKYYQENVFFEKSATPSVYERTYQFLNSVIKTDVVMNGNSVSCSVKINPDELSYIQSGQTVIDMINRGYHADTSLNGGKYNAIGDIHAKGHFWDDSIEELGGYNGILEIMKKNCKKVGLNVI